MPEGSVYFYSSTPLKRTPRKIPNENKTSSKTSNKSENLEVSVTDQLASDYILFEICAHLQSIAHDMFYPCILKDLTAKRILAFKQKRKRRDYEMHTTYSQYSMANWADIHKDVLENLYRTATLGLSPEEYAVFVRMHSEPCACE